MTLGPIEQVLRARAEAAFNEDMARGKLELEGLLTRLTNNKSWSHDTNTVGMICIRVVWPGLVGNANDRKQWDEFREACIVARTAVLSEELVESMDRLRDLEDEVEGLTS